MTEALEIFRSLEENDPEFRYKWARRLGRTLRAISSLQAATGKVEGAALFSQGRLALHFTVEALSVLPETRDGIAPLLHLQRAIARTRSTSAGRNCFAEAAPKRGRRATIRGSIRGTKTLQAATAVELLTRADPPMRLTDACETVAYIFRKTGVRGPRGDALSREMVARWHSRSVHTDMARRCAIEKQLEALLPLCLEDALAQTKLRARQALAHRKHGSRRVQSSSSA